MRVPRWRCSRLVTWDPLPSALGDRYIDPSARALAFPFFAPCDSRKSTLKLEQLHANVFRNYHNVA
jgi:hypothetical protein